MLPLEPDHFASAGVVIQSDTRSERTDDAEPASRQRGVGRPWTVAEKILEGLRRCLVVVDLYSHERSVANGDGHHAPDMTDDVGDEFARHQEHFGRVVDVTSNGSSHEVTSLLDAGGFGRQGDRAFFDGGHIGYFPVRFDLKPNASLCRDRRGRPCTMGTDSNRPTTSVDNDFQAVDAGARTPTSEIDRPVRGAPSDNTTLVSVLASLGEQGFTAQLIPAENASVQCGACNVTSPASSFEVLARRRLEGASDPDDMLTVIGARCPRCASKGALILGYGTNASEDDAAISVELGARRSGGSGDARAVPTREDLPRPTT